MSTDLDARLEELGLQRHSKEAPCLITWKEGSKSYPRNWPLRRRLFDSSVILFIQLFTTIMCTAGASLGSGGGDEYGLTRTTSVVVFLLTYQLGRIAGSVALPSWTETFGRRPSYIVTSFIYSAMCLVVGIVPSVAGACVGRIISGAMSAVGGTVAAGSLQELYDAQARIWAVFSWTAVSVAGIAIGPIYGSYITSALGWRWVFYIAAVIMFITACLCFAIWESRPSCVLKGHVETLRNATGEDDLRCETEDDAPDMRTFVKNTLLRPLVFLFTEPIVATVVTISAIAWALLFLFTESLTVVYGLYGFSDVQTSLFFIPIVIGILPSALLRIHDWQLLRLKSMVSQALKPEDKLLGFAIGAPVLAIGLWWFAWTIPQAVQTDWIVPSIALVLVGFAINEFEYVLAGYLVDCYSAYASSAVAALSTLRAIFSGSFPLFAYFMFTGISPNAASSILAGMATLFCVAPFVFMRYGQALRAKSPFARQIASAME